MYRKFIIIFFSVSIFIFFIAYPILFFMVLSHPTNAEINLERRWQYKESIARDISQPKMVFAAGSSVLHGIDTKLISEELKIPVVNMGTYAATRIYFMDRVQHSLFPGDILVLPIEYSIYTQRNFSDMGIGFVLSLHDDFFAKQSLIWKIENIYHVGIVNLLSIAKKVLINDDIEINEIGSNMNDNGDVDIIRSKNKEVAIPKNAFDDMELDSYNMSKLKELIDYCHQNNITVYAAWPSYLYSMDHFIGNDKVQIDKLLEFYSDNGVEVIGTYSDYLYNQEDMYDTKYHLNDMGRAKNTRRILDDLRPYYFR